MTAITTCILEVNPTTVIETEKNQRSNYLHKTFTKKPGQIAQPVHNEWPTDGDNTADIINEMIGMLQNADRQREEKFKNLLIDIKENIRKSLEIGGKVRYYFPAYPFNNNHWHDIVKFLHICLMDPERVKRLIKIPVKERIMDESINRLIYRWRNDRRVAFHANYNMVKSLVETAMQYRDQMGREEQSNRLMRLLEQLLEQHKQIILMGPPGTSKTYRAKRLAARLLGITETEVENEEAGRESAFAKAHFREDGASERGAWALVQFHAAYNYEDFVRGIQITTPPDGSAQPVYQTVHRLFGELAQTATAAWEAWKRTFPDKPPHMPDAQCQKFICIIDEINRAHLAAVLGELIYGLEYRGSAVNTPYAVDKDRTLVVPPNLYLIGTMNTADRSIGHIDYAVRRRFAFVPLQPQRSVVEQQKNDSVRTSGLALFDAMATLFGEGGYLAPDFHVDDVQVGHTYFLAGDRDALFMKFTYQVYPLLREYYKDGILIPKPGQEPGQAMVLMVNGKEQPIDRPVPPGQMLNWLATCCLSQSMESQPVQEDTGANAEESTT